MKNVLYASVEKQFYYIKHKSRDNHTWGTAGGQERRI